MKTQIFRNNEDDLKGHRRAHKDLLYLKFPFYKYLFVKIQILSKLIYESQNYEETYFS